MFTYFILLLFMVVLRALFVVYIFAKALGKGKLIKLKCMIKCIRCALDLEGGSVENPNSIN